MSKQKFKQILGSLVEKPKGKLTLVSETDKRQAVDPVQAEFKVEEQQMLRNRLKQADRAPMSTSNTKQIIGGFNYE